MKLLFYSPQFLPSVGGLQNVLHYWAATLAERGHNVTILCTTPGEDLPGQCYTVFRNADMGKKLRIMKAADLVVMFNVSLKAVPVWWLSRTPLIVSHHSAFRYDHLPANWQQKLKRQITNRLAKGNFACSRFIAADYKNCDVIPNPYNDDIFFNKNMPRPTASVLFVGRLVSDKGIDLLIHAVSELQKENYPNIHLTIVGIGPQEAELRALVERFALREIVHFTGALHASEINDQMNQHEVLVVPSRLEPFGIVVLEGLAAGCRLLASSQGGLPEALGEFGYYCEPGAIPSLKEALAAAINNHHPKPVADRAAHLKQFTRFESAQKLEQYLERKLLETGS